MVVRCSLFGKWLTVDDNSLFVSRSSLLVKENLEFEILNLESSIWKINICICNIIENNTKNMILSKKCVMVF